MGWLHKHTPPNMNTMAPAHLCLSNNGHQILLLKCESMQVASWHKQALAACRVKPCNIPYHPVAGELNPQCCLACSGINLLMSSGETLASSCLKLNNGGNGRPFGNHAWGSRNSSKNGCVHASSCNDNQVSNELNIEEHLNK